MIQQSSRTRNLPHHGFPGATDFLLLNLKFLIFHLSFFIFHLPFPFPLFNDKVFDDAVFDEGGVEGLFLVTHLDILKREVFQQIFVRLAYIKEILAIHVDLPQDNIVACR